MLQKPHILLVTRMTWFLIIAIFKIFFNAFFVSVMKDSLQNI